MTQLLDPNELNNKCMFERTNMIKQMNRKMSNIFTRNKDLEVEIEYNNNELIGTTRSQRDISTKSISKMENKCYNYPYKGNTILNILINLGNADKSQKLKSRKSSQKGKDWSKWK